MLKKNDFFKNCFTKSKEYKANIKKTKHIFNSFLKDLENKKIPLLESYQKDYDFDFSKDQIRKFLKYKNIIIIGMGGSILGTKSIYSFFKKKIKKEVFFIDNLDINLISSYKKNKNLKNTCFIVVSKSGNTLETVANLSLVLPSGLIKDRLVIITEIADNALTTIANKYNAEIIEHKEFIPGRYSILSETGMFPSLLMGLKINKFKNLNKLIKNNNFVSSLIQNVASIYTLNKKGLKNSVILNYDSSLNDLGYWYQQLVAESLGKNNKGINPILSFGPKDHHSLLQLYLEGPKDKFFTFFNSKEKNNNFKIHKDIIPDNMNFLRNKDLKFIIDSQFNAVKKIFELKKAPFRQINLDKKNEENFGEIITFFVLETILLSYLMDVNPFNQPAVEQVKIKTEEILR